jgi:hypothetical protein
MAWRRGLLAAAALVALVLAVLTFAVHDAKARILHALGPRTTVGAISLSYPDVTLRDVRIAADPTRGAWPAPEEFHAASVRIRIRASSLWAFRRGRALEIDAVDVSDGTLVMLRSADRVTLLPALRETTTAGAPASTPGDTTSLVVDRVHVERLAVDLVDATLPGKPSPRVHFGAVHGDIDRIALPNLDQPLALNLAGTLKGVAHDGSVSLKGTLAPAAHDASLAIALSDVDLLALQPYLLRLGERPVKSGRLDLVLDATVRDRALHAPGRVTLTGLKFDEAGGEDGTFAGVRRRAVLAALTRDGRITLKFTLDGRTDDPKFALDERLGTRIAAGLGEAVGVSVKGVVEGVGGVFKGLLGGKR